MKRALVVRALAHAAAIVAVALALFLPLGTTVREGTGADAAPFQYEVLGGISQDVRISSGWHGGKDVPKGWKEGEALDFVADYSLGKIIAWWLDPPTNTKPGGYKVHAVFRHHGGSAALRAEVRIESLNCKGIAVDLYDGETRVAIVEYLHADPNPNIDAKAEWTLATGGATTSSASVFGTHLATVAPEETKCPGAWTGAHLHQRVVVAESEDVKAKRPANIESRGHTDYGRTYSGGMGHWNRTWVHTRYLEPTTPGDATIANTDGDGVAHRYDCREDGQTKAVEKYKDRDAPSLAEGAAVRVLHYGKGAHDPDGSSGNCSTAWAVVTSPPTWLCAGADRAYWNLWRVSEPTGWNPAKPTTECPSWAPPVPPTATPTPTATLMPLPDVNCPDGTTVPNGETCPEVSCPDGTTVPNGETCPEVSCPDGTTVPNGETCPEVSCPDGTTVPNGETCPEVSCPDGTTVPNGETCPEVSCPNGTTVPNGQTCPTYSLSTSVSVCCGSISVSPSGPYYQGDDTPVTLAARPRGTVFFFDSWGGACAGETSATCNLTMDGNKSVTVSFTHGCDGNTGIGCRRSEEGDGNGGEPPPP